MEASAKPVDAGWFETIAEERRIIDWHEKQLASLERTYRGQRASIEAKLAFHKDRLLEAMRVARSAFNTSTIETPLGKVRIRKRAGVFVISDYKSALAWAKENGCVRIREEVAKSTMRKKLKAAPDGTLVTAEGEVVEFGRIEGAGEDSVSWEERG